MYVRAAHACLVPTESRRGASDPMDLEVETTVSYHVDAGKETWSSLEEQPALLTAEPPFQPPHALLILYSGQLLLF